MIHLLAFGITQDNWVVTVVSIVSGFLSGGWVMRQRTPKVQVQ